MLFIKHPRSGEKDTMLSLSVYAFFACLFKFLMNGVTYTVFDYVINFGTIDATLIAALLTPTLVAYSARKYTDSPDKAVLEIKKSKKKRSKKDE